MCVCVWQSDSSVAGVARGRKLVWIEIRSVLILLYIKRPHTPLYLASSYYNTSSVRILLYIYIGPYRMKTRKT